MLNIKTLAPITQRGVESKLRMFSKSVDITRPEKVKHHILNLDKSNAYKQKLLDSYDHFVKAYGLTWVKPRLRL